MIRIIKKRNIILGMYGLALIINFVVLNAKELVPFMLSIKGTVIDDYGVDSGLTEQKFESFKKKYFQQIIEIGFAKKYEKEILESAFNAKLNLERIYELRAIKAISGNQLQSELRAKTIFTGNITPLYHLRKGNPPKQPTISMAKSSSDKPTYPLPPVLDDRSIYFYDIEIDEIIKGKQYLELFMKKNFKIIRIKVDYFNVDMTLSYYIFGKKDHTPFYIESEFGFSKSTKSEGKRYLSQTSNIQPIWKIAID